MVFSNITRQWRKLPALYHHMGINLTVGLAIALAIHLMHDVPLIANQQERGLDFLLRITSGNKVPSSTTPTVILDIDSESYRKWGEPVTTPRDGLARLIRFAVEGGGCQHNRRKRPRP